MRDMQTKPRMVDNTMINLFYTRPKACFDKLPFAELDCRLSLNLTEMVIALLMEHNFWSAEDEYSQVVEYSENLISWDFDVLSGDLIWI